MRHFHITHIHKYGSDQRVVACEGDFIAAYTKADDPEAFITKHTGLTLNFADCDGIEFNELYLDDIIPVKL